ncbi:hypothetical protein [Clostridium merdae]|uniref:hypothetical protein n=1 Tax=Clostridium merdae TaxID=1958780 RepID=UPI000A26A410|nr:hypothetical protein [Clostridium merdae]
MRKDLEQKLLSVIFSGKNPEPVFGEIFQEYSGKICNAINPINRVSAPFIIAALEMYKRQIASKVPGSEKAAQDLIDKLPVQYIMMAMNRGEPQ